MNPARWAECANLDGKHEGWFEMFLEEAKKDRCPDTNTTVENSRPQVEVAASTVRKAPVKAERPEVGEGVGTEISLMLSRPAWSMMGIRVTESCKCKFRAAELNAKGIEWCEKNVDTIVQWLREEHRNQGIKVPFVDEVAYDLVNEAIRRAKRKAIRRRLREKGGS